MFICQLTTLPADHHFLGPVTVQVHIVHPVDGGAGPLHHRAGGISILIRLGKEIDFQRPVRVGHPEKGDRRLRCPVPVHILELNEGGVVAAHHGDVLHLHPVLLGQGVLRVSDGLGQAQVVRRLLRTLIQVRRRPEEAAGQGQHQNRQPEQPRAPMSFHVRHAPFPAGPPQIPGGRAFIGIIP